MIVKLLLASVLLWDRGISSGVRGSGLGFRTEVERKSYTLSYFGPDMLSQGDPLFIRAF